MITHAQFAALQSVTRVQFQSMVGADLHNAQGAAPKYLQTAFDATLRVYGLNVGTSVRPEIIPVSPDTGVETVEQFLARGGQIVKGAAVTAKGASVVGVVKSGTTLVRRSRG